MDTFKLLFGYRKPRRLSVRSDGNRRPPRRASWHSPFGAHCSRSLRSRSFARYLSQARTLSLETGWKLARAWYGRKLEADWQRHTVDEAEALFGKLGLAGDFWRLR